MASARNTSKASKAPEQAKPRPSTFRGTLERVVRGVVQYAVTVPREVSEAYGPRKAVPVVAMVEGVEARLTLIPQGGGRHRLILSERLRRRAKVGDSGPVTIRVALDEAPPVDPVPEDLADALREADALAAFDGIVRTKRNALLRWFEDAVADRTRRKRVAKLVEIALAEREKSADRTR